MSDTPLHVAIILDGNRRWAVGEGLSKLEGHIHGAKNIRPVAEYALEQGVRYLTLYALSTENVKNRTTLELKKLFNLFAKLADYQDLFDTYQIRVRFLGNRDGLPPEVQKVFDDIEKKTADYDQMTLAFAVNYGGRDEILRAAQKSSELKTENDFALYLDTAGMPDVDLLIRTGGHHRLSNFLLWQAAYSELYFTPIMWPAFSPVEFGKALTWFAEQKRNKGK